MELIADNPALGDEINVVQTCCALVGPNKGGGARNVGCRFKLICSVESTFILCQKFVDL